MDTLKFSKLSSFVLPVAFIILISLAIMTAIIYVEKQAKHNIHKSLFTVLEITREALHRWADNHLQDLIDITNNPLVLTLTEQQLDSERLLNKAQFNNEFKRIMLLEMSQYENQSFMLINCKGIIVASKDSSEIGTESPLFSLNGVNMKKLLRGENVFIPPVKLQTVNVKSKKPSMINTRIKKEPIVLIGAPIFNNDGDVIAALIFGFPMTHFTQITELGRIGNTGETYAFDNLGLLITKSRFTQNLKLLGVLGNKNKAMLSINITDPGVNLIEGFLPTLSQTERPLTLMAQNAIKGNRAPYYNAYRDYRGVPVLGAWVWSQNLDIGLATEIDEKEALETYFVIRFVLISVLLVIILLIVGLAFLPVWFKERERTSLEQHRVSLEKIVGQRTEQLEQANHRLKILSELDSLTCIANRRLYNHTLVKAIAMANRTCEPLALLMIDIDYFKRYNDHYGHDKGDIILQEVAMVITQSLTRTNDFVARYGGEEFVVILPETSQKSALLVAEKVRRNIEGHALEHLYSYASLVVTVSVGVSSLDNANLSKNSLFQKADHALYLAKGKGRNQIAYENS